MRMRKKKNLAPRLEACDGYLISVDIPEADVREAIRVKEYFNFEEMFRRNAPVFLEIGCGKGHFICELARRHPENNYIAVENVANVIVSAAETAKEMELENVKFLNIGAELLERFIPSHSIAGIYLNFSSPYPKGSYANRRLTSPRFLKIWKELLAPGAEIHQKTDNMHFFEYSIEQYTQEGFLLREVNLDLHNSSFTGNIETEYEHRFASQGLPIYRLAAYLKEEK